MNRNDAIALLVYTAALATMLSLSWPLVPSLPFPPAVALLPVLVLAFILIPVYFSPPIAFLSCLFVLLVSSRVLPAFAPSTPLAYGDGTVPFFTQYCREASEAVMLPAQPFHCDCKDEKDCLARCEGPGRALAALEHAVPILQVCCPPGSPPEKECFVGVLAELRRCAGEAEDCFEVA